MTSSRIEAFSGRERREISVGSFEEGRRDPVSYFVDAVQGDKAIEGMVSPEFNVGVMEIVEAAQRSARTGRPVALPLR